MLLFSQTVNTEPSTSLLRMFLDGLGWGFVSVLQPCLYAMFPVTVSFFLKRSNTRAHGIRNALLYSVSIIAIFTLLGFLLVLVFGKDILYQISTSAVFNLFVFVLFVVFGISFLGAFEITLPSSWINKADSKSHTGSFSGIFFMALTLVLVSFSCTAPFIGKILVDISKHQNRLAAVFGFLGFSTAIALPFAFFAFFPGLLNKIAKSGGWLNSLKVSFGFIELAMALKFFSNADLAYHWRILDRDVFLSIWIILSLLLGLYLLGILKLKHDDHLPSNYYGHPHISVARLFFAISCLSFTVYMIPGLFGAPLNGISGWLPENKTQDFNLEKLIRSNSYHGKDTINAYPQATVKPIKYTDILQSEIPGVQVFFDFDEAIAAAKQSRKPIMLDFTGHSCANCRKMESEVLSRPEVSSILSKDIIVASLYVDEKRSLPESEKYTSIFDSSKVSSVGGKNLDLEATIANSNAQPLYIFTDQEGKIIRNAGGYESGVPRFIKILNDVKDVNKKRFP
jgi:thiol:disulfide interchange protein DsbD